MPRTPLWTSIAETLTDDIAAGRYRPGDKLPTEAELSQRFGVNRHTVRRALAALGDGGMVHSRRGAGVFVAARPTEYPIGRRVRFSQNVKASGRTPDREILRLETRPADDSEAEALNLSPGAQVHVYEVLSMADGAPLALGRSVFSAARFPDLPSALRDTNSVTEAFRRNGVDDYTRAWTRLNAQLASATQALHLRIREAAPILHTTSVNVDADGTPVEYGLCWFAGDRVNLVVTNE